MLIIIVKYIYIVYAIIYFFFFCILKFKKNKKKDKDWKIKLENIQKLSDFALFSPETVCKHKHNTKYFDLFANFINDSNTKVH
jgi:hypothetical protein